MARDPIVMGKLLRSVVTIFKLHMHSLFVKDELYLARDAIVAA